MKLFYLKNKIYNFTAIILNKTFKLLKIFYASLLFELIIKFKICYKK